MTVLVWFSRCGTGEVEECPSLNLAVAHAKFGDDQGRFSFIAFERDGALVPVDEWRPIWDALRTDEAAEEAEQPKLVAVVRLKPPEGVDCVSAIIDWVYEGEDRAEALALAAAKYGAGRVTLEDR